MDRKIYAAPPITEAVVEIRFSEEISDAEQAKIAKKLATFYPIKVEQRAKNAHIDVENESVEFGPSELFYRLSNRDETEILLIHRSKISLSRLAPYSGWNEFRARIERDWKVYKSVTGYKKIVRIGMRYINRLDLPLEDDKVVESDYMNAVISLPSPIDTHAAFTLTATCPLPDIEGAVTVRSATVEPAIVGRASFLLDFDLFREHNLPQKDREMFALLETFASKKNELFEASITDRTRALFNARKA